MIYFLEFNNYIPLQNFSNIIINYLKENKFKVEKGLPKNKEDIFITFPVLFVMNKKYKIENIISNNIILINTEALYSHWFIRMKNILFNNKVKYILDYCYKNIKILNQLIIKQKFYYCPPCYNKYFENLIPDNKCKDIDILFLGLMNNRREKIKQDLKNELKDYNILFDHNFNETYQLISRSKIILDMHFYEENFAIDYYRTSILISNKKFVIHESVQKEEEESEEYKILSKSLVFCKYDDIVKTCKKYIQLSSEERDLIAEQTYNIFKNELYFDKYFPKNILKLKT
tara:strand:+ start:181 stop:1041 length:861 start_codon:yes stop_codon:yes gene_type:complete